MDTETIAVRLTPPDKIDELMHWQIIDIARQMALGMHSYPLSEQERRRALIEWIVAVGPMFAADRPDIPEEGRERILTSIMAHALLKLRELDAMTLPNAGRA